MLPLLQAILLIFVAIGAVGVVAAREPFRQTIALSFYGLLLAMLFFVFQAPDVALSVIVVGTVATPLMILLALAKVKEQPSKEERDQGEERA